MGMFLFLYMRDAKLKPREVTEVSQSRTDSKQQCQNLIPGSLSLEPGYVTMTLNGPGKNK